MTKITKELAEGLRWLAETDEWDADDKAEAKRALENDPAFFSHFFMTWIQAKRMGYKFRRNGRYVKLAQFCAENGLPNPYLGQHTDKEIDE